MRAVGIKAFGGPEALEMLTVKDPERAAQSSSAAVVKALDASRRVGRPPSSPS